MGGWSDGAKMASLCSASFGWRLAVWEGIGVLLSGPPVNGRELGDGSNDDSAPPAPTVRAVVVSIAGGAEEVTPIVAPSALVHNFAFEP